MSRGFREKAAEPGDIRTGFQRERMSAEPRRAGRKSISRRNSSRSSSSAGGTPRCPWDPGPGAGGPAGSKAADADAGAVYPAAFKRVWGPLCLHFCVKH